MYDGLQKPEGMGDWEACFNMENVLRKWIGNLYTDSQVYFGLVSYPHSPAGTHDPRRGSLSFLFIYFLFCAFLGSAAHTLSSVSCSRAKLADLFSRFSIEDLWQVCNSLSLTNFTLPALCSGLASKFHFIILLLRCKCHALGIPARRAGEHGPLKMFSEQDTHR